MKIYLAGPCDNENRTLMVRIGKYLRRQGFEVYCPFELQIENAWDLTQEDWAQKVFYADKTAIENCDFFLMISKGRISSAGTNWEQGYAKGIGKTVFVFQITREPTSLMTFCGCDYFYNTSEEDIINVLHDVTIMLCDDDWKQYFILMHKRCETVLT
jgi:nucleoside 2-deoxyribosyltransferase